MAGKRRRVLAIRGLRGAAPTADIVLEASAAETVDVSLVVRDVESVDAMSEARGADAARG